MSSISAGAPIFTPKAGKHEQNADLHGSFMKYYLAKTYSNEGIAETWGGTAANAFAIPADSGLFHDRAGGLANTFFFGSANAMLSDDTTGATTNTNGATRRILFPANRRGFSLKSVKFNLIRSYGANGVTGYASINFTIKAVKTDGTTRTLGSGTTEELSSTSQVNSYRPFQIILASSAAVEYDERICIDWYTISRNSTGGYTGLNYWYSWITGTTTMQHNPWAAHYEGFFSSIILEIA